jgi:hypothetical protein
MQEIDKQESVEPIEIQELKGILGAEYKNAEVSYTDYTTVYDMIKDENPQILISEGDDDTESFVSPIGRVGGRFRTELFVHALRNPLPDPVDSDSKILIYPSFDKENNISKLRLLKYPTKLLENVKKEFDEKQSTLKLPSDMNRLKQLPKVRVGLENEESKEVITFEPLLNSTNTVYSRYTQERVSKLKSNVRNIKWGTHTVLPYKNSKGENILLTLKNS